jgi:hypothetical protein
MLSQMSLSEPLGATPLGGAHKLTASASAPASAPRTRSAISARRGRFGLAGLLVAGIVITCSASKTGLLLPASVQDLPAWLVGPFGHNGINLGMGGVIAVLALMMVSYAVAIRAADHLSARAVLISIAALNLLVLLAPPLLSTDIFSYMAYGRMAAKYGANPYLYGPSTILTDPLYPFIGANWVGMPTAYGPLFTALSSALAPLNIAAGVVVYKTIAAISMVVIVFVVWHTARLRDLNPVKAAALVGLNPVLLVFGVGGGHNDLLMLAILLTGVYVLLRKKERTSGALIVTASVVKLTAGLLLPFALAASAGRRDGAHRRVSLLTGAALAAVLAGVLGFVLFGSGPLHVLGTLGRIQKTAGAQSIPGLILKVLGLGALSGPVALVLDAAFLACLIWLLRLVWKGELDWITGAGWATLALLVTAGQLVPWYVGWLVPLAALSRDRRLLVATIAMTGLGLTTL